MLPDFAKQFVPTQTKRPLAREMGLKWTQIFRKGQKLKM